MSQHSADKWIEINLDSVEHNLKEINAVKDEKLLLIAVVKANAYGHGAGEIAQVLQKNGVNFFAVSYLDEALALRKAGIDGSILLFVPLTSAADIKLAAENRITLTVGSKYDCKLVQKISTELNRTITVHIKVETGLSRFGLLQNELVEVARELNGNSSIVLEGIYTHMADASNPAFTEKQFAIFSRGLKQLEENQIHIKIGHCANSSVFLKYPHMHLDAVRIGTLLSGQYPAGKFEKHLHLEDPYHFKSQIIALKSLPAGSFLGYKRTYRLKRNAQIAVVPVGYSDGLALEIANSPESLFDLLKKILKLILAYLNLSRFILHVKIKDSLYPVRGKVFMQMALIEIPPEVPVEIGDEVELPVRKTLTSADLVRVFMREGQAVQTSADLLEYKRESQSF